MCSMKEQFHSHTEGKRAPWSNKLGKDKFNLFLSFWDCQSWELKCDSKWISWIRYLALFSWPMVIRYVTSHSFPALNTMYCADNFSLCISSPHLSSEHQTECSQFPQRYLRDIWTFIFPQPPPSGFPSSAHGNFILQVTQAKNLSTLHNSSISPIPHI